MANLVKQCRGASQWPKVAGTHCRTDGHIWVSLRYLFHVNGKVGARRGINRFCTCQSFPTRWSLYFFRCRNTCRDRHFPLPNSIMRCPNHVTLGCLLSCPTLWEPSNLILPPIARFFGGSFTQAKVCFLFNRHSFEYHISTFSLMYRLGASTWLIVCLSTPTFHLTLTHFLITLCSHFGWPHHTITQLSWCECGHTIDYLGTHFFRCPYGSEHTSTHNTLQDIVATHVQREVSYLFFRHTQQGMDIFITKNDFDGHCHCWSDSHKYGTTNIDNDNTCNEWWWLLKTWSYMEWTLGDDFIPFTIEMYGCFHFHFDFF
jgi:hypothetical protein